MTRWGHKPVAHQYDSSVVIRIDAATIEHGHVPTPKQCLITQAFTCVIAHPPPHLWLDDLDDIWQRGLGALDALGVEVLHDLDLQHNHCSIITS